MNVLLNTTATSTAINYCARCGPFFGIFFVVLSSSWEPRYTTPNLSPFALNLGPHQISIINVVSVIVWWTRWRCSAMLYKHYE